MKPSPSSPCPSPMREVAISWRIERLVYIFCWEGRGKWDREGWPNLRKANSKECVSIEDDYTFQPTTFGPFLTRPPPRPSPSPQHFHFRSVPPRLARDARWIASSTCSRPFDKKVSQSEGGDDMMVEMLLGNMIKCATMWKNCEEEEDECYNNRN